MPRIKIAPRDPMTRDEVKDMIERAKTLRDKALIACLYLLGSRITEILTLKKSDVIITDDEVTFVTKPLKRRNEQSPLLFRRSLTFPRTALFMDFFVKWAGGIAQEDGFLFPSYGKHGHLTRQRAWQIIKELNPNTFPHFFRHTRGTWVYEESGNDLIATKEWLGRITLPVEYIGRRSIKLDRLAKRIS